VGRVEKGSKGVGRVEKARSVGRVEKGSKGVGDIPRLSKAGWLRLKKWLRSLEPQAGRLVTECPRSAPLPFADFVTEAIKPAVIDRRYSKTADRTTPSATSEIIAPILKLRGSNTKRISCVPAGAITPVNA